MKDENRKDLLFVLFMLTVVTLAVIYFTGPERKEFLEFQSQWWREFIDTFSPLSK